MKTVLAVLALVALSNAMPSPYVESDKPAFCHKLDCPEYQVMNKTDAYELRCYKTYFWASTTVTGIDYDKAGEVAFMRLFKYIQGENVKKVKIAMTVPVTATIQPGPGPVCASNFTYSFFVPFDYQSDPVPPTASDVFLDKQNLGCVYVAVYSGFSDYKKVVKNVKDLTEALDKAGLKGTYRTDMYFTAGYDSPFVILDRHNEVWLMKITKTNVDA